MDSSHTNNTGSANFISDYNTLSGPTPASDLDASYRTTVFGYPILVYYKLTPNDTTQYFIGVYNCNLDKACTGSFGFEEKLEDSDKVEYDFKDVRFYDDAMTEDILVKATIDGTGLTETEDVMNLVIKQDDSELKVLPGKIMADENGNKIAAKYNEIYYRINYIDDKPYMVLKNPNDNVECALLTEENFIKTITGEKVSSTQCDEFKANSGAAGAGGFGNYALGSISKDLECRYPDDGDLEEELYAPYEESTKDPISFSHFRSGWYYNYQRMMKWVMNSSEEEFLKNVSRHFNKSYLMDYYLTIMLLGGVDSLGKNLMVATWGPENHLFETSAAVMNPAHERHDPYAFECEIDGQTRYLTPTKSKESGNYIHAKNADGLMLYYKEEYFNRATKLFENGHTKFDSDCVTTVPGEAIFYPIFYDIDTINGLDNSGHLIFDVDIEIGDQLVDGTAVFNTDDSHLWRRVRDYLGRSGELAERWKQLRDAGYFTENNLINKFYYERQIAKIPEKYYNDDCFLKYVWEGPNPQKGSGAYLYCIHGSRYEHIKRWYSQRIHYIDTMFGTMGGTNASLRFNHGSYDANFGHTTTYYASYPALAASRPDIYKYEQTTGKLLDAKTNREIIPINFNVKTYQPAYVGVKWGNNSQILYYRVGRNGSANMNGNVPSAGDSEVFLYGGENIKEIGDMSPYNVKQVDFANLKKLSKLILGSTNYSTVINTLNLGNNTYIADLQLVNCSSLPSVDVSGCSNLRTIDMTGSGITTVTLPNGGALESVSYSDKITSINLQDFVNLIEVNTPNLTNLTQLIIKNCPKILGSKEIPNAKGWAILQQTHSAHKKGNLTNIEMTSYGKVDPVITAGEQFFFADAYYNYATASKIRGEVYYSGSTIPTNYTKFDTSYPKLKISYTNIKDASEMFADYRNLNCIKSINAYIGINAQGVKQYKYINVWADESDELKSKWYGQDTLNKYGISDEYKSEKVFYQDASGTIYRPLGIHDKDDLDTIRTQIKNALSNFEGTQFTNVKGMFRNLHILDYIDEDTFNGIDLSVANTDEMFYGCVGLRYFTLPGDNLKNNPIYVFLDADGFEVSEEEWDSETGTIVQKEDDNGNLLYRNPFTKDETTKAEDTYKKGIRNIGENMFFECRRARILIKKLSTDEKISIEPNAFKYVTFDPSLESQDRTVTVERPVVMFEHSDLEILRTTTEPSRTDNENNIIKYPSAGENLYFELNEYGERIANYQNSFINFNNTNAYLREVYFGVSKLVHSDNKTLEGFTVGYAERSDGKRILIDVSRDDVALSSFNGSGMNYCRNKMNLISVCQGSLENVAGLLNDIEIPVPNYDCLDTKIPRQAYEKHILSVLSSENFTNMDPEKMKNICNTITLKEIYICCGEVIPYQCFMFMGQLNFIGIAEDTKYIEPYAFYECSQLHQLSYQRFTGVGTYTYLEELSKLEKIGESAFENSGLAVETNLPNSINIIERNAFRNCAQLPSIKYPSNLKYIPSDCFMGCSRLERITGVSDDLEKIEASAFYNCFNLEILNENGTFGLAPEGQNLNYFKKLVSIGPNAFYKCNKMSSGNPIELDDGSFEYITKKLIIPENIKEIGQNAFYQDLGEASQINIEFIWEGSDYSGLSIGGSAFANIRTAWKPEGYEKAIRDIIFIPRISMIGSMAFKSRSVDSSFNLSFAKQSEEEIGNGWAITTKKFIFSYAGMLQEGTYTYIFSDDGKHKYAYLYHVAEQLNQLKLPKEINYNGEKYLVKEVLSGALDLSEGTLATIVFNETYGFDKIEPNVLKSNILNVIMTETVDGEYVLNTIPEGFEIASGNNLKNTAWFSSIASDSKGKFIKLGEYIIGFSPEDDTIIESLDLSDEDISNCKHIYDNAFSGLTDLNAVNIPDNIESIYQSAFEEATSLREVEIPNSVKLLGGNAFAGAPIAKIFIPNSVEEVGENVFGSSRPIGDITSFIIEDGSKLKLDVLPFTIAREIKTNMYLPYPTDANISLRRLHIPSTVEMQSLNNILKTFAQITDLTVGNLKKANDGSYNVPNYPIVIQTVNGVESKVVKKVLEAGDVQATNINGELLYCPAFYYDMYEEAGQMTSYETTESHGIYPLSDTEDYDGFANDLDITFIKNYKDKSAADKNTDISHLEIDSRDLTGLDIMRIIAGFTRKGTTQYKLFLRNRDNNKLTTVDRLVFGSLGYKVAISPNTTIPE